MSALKLFVFSLLCLQLIPFLGPIPQAQAQDCPAPTAYNNSENYSVNSVLLQWGFSGSQQTQFTLEIKTTGETSWSSVAAITSTGYSVTGLAPRTNYVWRVKADCSPFSNIATVSTDGCRAYSFLARPESSSALLEWRSALNTTYNLSWRPEGGEWTSVTSLTGTFRFSSSIPRHSLSATYSLTGLNPNNIYEWKVEAVCGSNFNSVSSPLTFTAICNPPLNLTTSSIYTDIAFLNWRSVYYNAKYLIQYRPKLPQVGDWLESSNFSYGYVTNPNYFVTSPYVGSVTGLTSGTEYEIRVRAECTDGTSSVFTPTISFYTSVPPCNIDMTTIRPGLWTDPTIWSCGRVPVGSDPVYVMHNVLIPDNVTGRAGRVFYGFGGQVRLSAGASLLLGR